MHVKNSKNLQTEEKSETAFSLWNSNETVSLPVFSSFFGTPFPSNDDEISREYRLSIRTPTPDPNCNAIFPRTETGVIPAVFIAISTAELFPLQN